MKKKNLIFLFLIIILAAFLRLWQLSSVPPSASLDEVSLGYNAYSILQTGKDEYGKDFPLILRAYDDWRPALYVYFVAPFLKLFGLEILAVRFPSVILSVITVLATYFLVKELFKEKTKNLSNLFNSENLALLSSFLLAISPWHIYISRLGHEVNLGLSFAVFALLFAFWRKIYIATFFFILSFISYQTEKIFIPILLIGLFIIFRKELLLVKKKVILILIASLVIISPFIKATFSENALIRFSGTNVFKANEHRFIERSFLLDKAVKENDLIGQALYNRRILYAQIFLEGYLSHFNPVWLIGNPSEDKHKVPDVGLLSIWVFPLALLGMYTLIRYSFDIKTKQIIFWWFIIAPVAASLTTETPHALRSFVFLPTWQIFASLGAIFTSSLLRNDSLRKLSLAVFALVVFFSIQYFYRQYFYVFPIKQASSFQYSISQAILFVLENQKSYKKVIFSNHDRLYQSYMFFLFYSKYDPNLYQKQGGTSSGGYLQTHEFGKYEFRPINILKEKKGNLYVGNYYDFDIPRGTEFAKSIKVLKIIMNLKGEKRLKIITIE